MSQLGQERVPLGAFVDAKQKDAVRELARRSDRSVSAIVRRAIAHELERTSQDPGQSSTASLARSSPQRAPRTTADGSGSSASA